MPNFPVATFIQGATFIPDSRVGYINTKTMLKNIIKVPLRWSIFNSQHMASLAVFLGAMESSEVKAEVLEVIELMGKLANISLPRFVLDKDTLYNPTTLKELSGGEGLPQSWTDYVQKLFNFGDKKIDIEDTERVIIEDTNYYKMLSSVLQTTKKKTLANYAGWKIVLASLNHIESKELWDIFPTELVQKKPMWKTCSETVGFNSQSSALLLHLFVYLITSIKVVSAV